MAKDILKEAIADAKAVREVALANAKAALEEAFTPKLQSMLSAKLSEELNEVEEDEIKEDVTEETTIDEVDDIDEMVGMDEDEQLDEEIDLEEILNELELEEGEAAEETLDEEVEDVDEAVGYPNYRADQVRKVHHQADDINQGLNENEDFDLDALLNEINNLDETNDDVEEGKFGDTLKDLGRAASAALRGGGEAADTTLSDNLRDLIGSSDSYEDWAAKAKEAGANNAIISGWKEFVSDKISTAKELEETKLALKTVRTELNEVNLLNSKLLYVNRIFKANTLDDVQKLRVVETLDKAESAKEAKLIYETIKDTFTISKGKKAAPKRSLKEGLGMASKAAGKSTAPKKEILNESNNMVARMQKLANITIKQ
jgi:hypothetical protein